MIPYEQIVMKGEPTEEERQKALETYSAYRLGLVKISAWRQFPEHVRTEAVDRFRESPANDMRRAA